MTLKSELPYCRRPSIISAEISRAFNLAEFRDGKPQQPIPASLVDHEDDLYGFHKHCKRLVLKILTLFAIGLKVLISNMPSVCKGH